MLCNHKNVAQCWPNIARLWPNVGYVNAVDFNPLPKHSFAIFQLFSWVILQTRVWFFESETGTIIRLGWQSAGWQCEGPLVLKGGICHFAKWQIPPFNTEVSHPIIYPSSQVQRLVYKQPFLLGLSFCPWRPRHGWIRTGLPGSSHTCWRAFRIVPFPPDQYHLDFSAEDAGKQR